MKNLVPMWLKGLCVPRTIAKLLSVSFGLTLGASGQGVVVVPDPVSLWREWMVNRDITGPRLYMWADRDVLQTGATTAQFQNGSYAFLLADGGVPDVDGDLDGHTDGQEISAAGPGDPNDIDSVPVDDKGKELPLDAFIVSLADNTPLGLANSTRAAVNSRATLVNPYSGNSVRISAAPGDSKLQRPFPLTDYSTQFYYTNSSGYSDLFRLSLYYQERDFPNPGDANSLETAITPGGYQVEFPPIANPVLRAGLTATHRLLPNGSLTIGMKKPTWLVRSLSTIERFDRPPVPQSWVNGRLKFDPNRQTVITWDNLVGNGLASTADRIRLWVETEDGESTKLTLNIATPSTTQNFGPLYGDIRGHLGESFSTLSKNGFIVLRYERSDNGASTADLSYVTLRIPVQMAVSYVSWRKEFFSGADYLDDSISGPNADPDNDGLTNQQEFDAGSDPVTATIAISDPFSESITTNSATLGGTVELDTYSNANVTIFERGVVYSASSTNPFPLIDGPGVSRVPSSLREAGTFAVDATGLTDNTQYSFCAYVITDQGTFYTAPVSTFITPARPPVTLPTVTSPTSSNVLANTATLGGNVTSDGGAPVTVRGIVYSVTSANDNPFIGGAGVIKLDLIGGDSTGLFTLNAAGLAASTTYSFRAYATNSVGTSYTSIGMFTTARLPTVTSPTFTSVTSNSALLGGNVTSNGGVPILQRGVVFSLTSVNINPVMGGNGVTAFAASSTGTGVFTVNATGLAPNRSYSFKAYAINVVGTAYTSTGTFTTPGTLPAVSSPTIASLTASSVTLGANVTSNGGLALIERGFVYAPTAVNNNPTIGGTGVIPVIAPGTTTGAYSAAITGLAPNTGYTFKPFARNSAGVAYGAPYAFFTTLSPLTVTSPTAASITETSALLGGTVVSDGGTTATERGVVYSIDNPDPVVGGPDVFPKVTAPGTMGVFTTQVNGLSSDTTYYFRAYAINSAGTSYSQVATFKTLPLMLAGSPAVEWVTLEMPAVSMLQSMSVEDGAEFMPASTALTEPEIVKVPEFVYQKAPEEVGKPISFEIETTTDFVQWTPINQDHWVVEELDDQVRARWNSTEVSPPAKIFFRVRGAIK